MKHSIQKNEAEYLQELKTLRSPGLSDEDIEAHLLNTANSNIQDMVDVYSEQYRKAHSLKTLPEGIWQPLNRFARQKCAAHLEKLAAQLKDKPYNSL